ncbi:MAG: GNAT family N-acetyltransferase [Pseudonocardiaceae bacterium]
MGDLRRLDLSDEDTVQQVWKLQRMAYEVEAELIGYDGIPPLHESLDQLRTCGEFFLGRYEETGLTGAVSWTRPDGGTLDICRLMVHPRAHRSGIATALLNVLDALEPAERTIVSTGTANIPALALYRNRGFVPTGEQQIAPGITTTQLIRRAASAPRGRSGDLLVRSSPRSARSRRLR